MSRETYKSSNTDDGSPEKPLERMEYVARVSSFFKDILTKKIDSMMTIQHNTLANPMNTPAEDMRCKGTINALALLLDWRDECESEYLDLLKNPPIDMPEDET